MIEQKFKNEKVVVLMGGLSSEREVSFESGKTVMNALKNNKIHAESLDPAEPDFIKKLIKGKFTKAFIALHGTYGEDGTIQGVLEYLKIPYTGSGVTASAICFDKIKTKKIWQSVGLPTPPFLVFNADYNNSESFIEQCGFPLAVKPACQGSSMGVKKVINKQELVKACYEISSNYGETIIEPWITGDEYTVCILNGIVLPEIQIIPELNKSIDFYDYSAKYQVKTTKYLCPSNLNKDKKELIKKIAKDSFITLGASGWGRVDLMQDVKGDFWLLEVNTIPGLNVLFPKSAIAIGIDKDQLILDILSTASLKNNIIQEKIINEA